MGFFDSIAKKAKETAATASTAYNDASKSIKEKTIGELIDSAIDAGSKVVSHISESVSFRAVNLTMKDVDNETKKIRKSDSKVIAYEQRKLAHEKKESSNKIVEETKHKSSHLDFLDDFLDDILG